jgi:hypothetical protein
MDSTHDTKADIESAPDVTITKDDLREDDAMQRGEEHEPALTANGEPAKEGVKAVAMPGGSMEHRGAVGNQS